MGIDHLLCLTLNTNDSLKQFLRLIFPKIKLKCERFSYIPKFQHSPLTFLIKNER